MESQGNGFKKSPASRQGEDSGRKGLSELFDGPSLPLSLAQPHPVTSVYKTVPYPDQETRHKAHRIYWDEFIDIAEKHGAAALEALWRYLEDMRDKAEKRLHDVGATFVTDYHKIFPEEPKHKVAELLQQRGSSETLQDRLWSIMAPESNAPAATKEFASVLRQLLWEWAQLYPAVGLLQHRLVVLNVIRWRVAVLGDYRKHDELSKKETDLDSNTSLDLQRKLDDSNRERENAHNLIKKQKQRITALITQRGKKTPDEMTTLIDQHRMRNGKVNFASLGRALGLTGTTVKSRIKILKLLPYALTKLED